ncbi:unnamed protein product [Cyprideis torosa]|uniref:Uncharacterized protein n=1 Tax=Cyprideis torosa TaxID=163714 RepID=A0A7R8ZWD0_9CRUS|nr:unnamed protein product [Cyprideis torosa]CAG0911200.1 unnamed protein product [Cyprideis torosa]
MYLRAVMEGFFEEGGKNARMRKDLSNRFEKEGRQSLYAELVALDKEYAASIHPNDTQRLLRALEIYYATGETMSTHFARQEKGRERRFSRILLVGLGCDREDLYQRINRRTDIMFECGFKDEVEWLLARGYDRHLKPLQSIGYRHMIEHICDGVALDECKALLARDTRRYAKRQMTWFRKMDLRWFHVTDTKGITQCIDQFLKNPPAFH